MQLERSGSTDVLREPPVHTHTLPGPSRVLTKTLVLVWQDSETSNEYNFPLLNLQLQSIATHIHTNEGYVRDKRVLESTQQRIISQGKLFGGTEVSAET